MRIPQIQKIGIRLIIGIMMIMMSPLSSFAADVTVTTIEDERNSDGDCSLREAIAAANTDTSVDACGSGNGDDTITFAPEVTGTIILNGTQLIITTNVVMTGPGAHDLAISGNDTSRVFAISGASTTVSMSGVTIRNGQAEDGGGIFVDGATLTLQHSEILNNTSTINVFGRGGGGIRNVNRGTVIVEHCLFKENDAFRGGGIHNGDCASTLCTLEVTNSLFSHNRARYGGGLYHRSGSAALESVTFTANTVNTPDTTGGGAGIANVAHLTILNSTLRDNVSASIGGGIYNYQGTLELTNSTVSGNSAATHGGGLITIDGTMTVTHCTITTNTADASADGEGDGGGIAVDTTGTVSLANTIVAGNTDSGHEYPDTGIAGTLLSQDYNLIGNQGMQSFPATTGDQVGDSSNPIDPQLGVLADNGGPTWTHALLAGSPAIDVIPNGTNGCGTSSTHDQRGDLYVRPSPAGGRCDIGAVESQSVIPSSLIVTTIEDELNGDGDCSLREAIEAANTDTSVDACGSGNGDDTITFAPDVTGTITLNGTQLTIVSAVTIAGPGAEHLAISGGGLSRVFMIEGAPGTAVTISGLTITTGDTGDEPDYHGGGLFNLSADVTLDSVMVSNNRTGGDGGGLANVGRTMTVKNSTVTANQANGEGGGLANVEGTMMITNSTVSGNIALSGAGVVMFSGTLTLTQCTVTENQNTGNRGDEAAIYAVPFDGTLNLSNTIIADNHGSSTARDCTLVESSMGSDRGNLIGSHLGCGNPVVTSGAELGPLQDNGGSTWTHALLAGSAAIDAGDPDACLETDQRGMSRPVDGDGDGTAACDIGAVEYQPNVTYQLTVTKQGTGDGTVFGEGIECGYDCTETYADGTILDLQAYPDDWSTFTGWLIDGESPQEGEIVINGDITLTAVFDKISIPDFETVSSRPAECDYFKDCFPLSNTKREIVGVIQGIQIGDELQEQIIIHNKANLTVRSLLDAVVVPAHAEHVVSYGDEYGDDFDEIGFNVSEFHLHSFEGSLFKSVNVDVGGLFCVADVSHKGDFWIAGRQGKTIDAPFVLRHYAPDGELMWEQLLPTSPRQLLLSPDNGYATLVLREPGSEQTILRMYAEDGRIVSERELPPFLNEVDFVSEQKMMFYSASRWELYRLDNLESPYASGRFAGRPFPFALHRTIIPFPPSACFLVRTAAVDNEDSLIGYHLQAVHWETGETLAERLFETSSVQELRFYRVTEQDSFEVLINWDTIMELRIPK